MEKFIRYVGAVLVSDPEGRTRYLSKNNNNILRLPALARAFPQALILIPFRDPLTHAASLLAPAPALRRGPGRRALRALLHDLARPSRVRRRPPAVPLPRRRGRAEGGSGPARLLAGHMVPGPMAGWPNLPRRTRFSSATRIYAKIRMSGPTWPDWRGWRRMRHRMVFDLSRNAGESQGHDDLVAQSRDIYDKLKGKSYHS